MRTSGTKHTTPEKPADEVGGPVRAGWGRRNARRRGWAFVLLAWPAERLPIRPQFPGPACAGRVDPEELPVPSSPDFACTVTSTGSETLLGVTGEIDGAVAGRLHDTLLTAARAGVPVILDLSGVSFCDSSGLTALVNGHRAGTAAGVEFVIVAAQRAILRPFALTGLDTVLPVQPDLAAARAAAGSE